MRLSLFFIRSFELTAEAICECGNLLPDKHHKRTLLGPSSCLPNELSGIQCLAKAWCTISSWLVFCLLQVKEGDKVLYFKWAGENMETPSGEQFVVVHEQDILCKQR